MCLEKFSFLVKKVEGNKFTTIRNEGCCQEKLAAILCFSDVFGMVIIMIDGNQIGCFRHFDLRLIVWKMPAEKLADIIGRGYGLSAYKC